MNYKLFTTLLLGGFLFACSGGDTPTEDNATEVISEADADAAAEAAIQTEDDAKAALEALESDIGDGY